MHITTSKTSSPQSIGLWAIALLATLLHAASVAGGGWTIRAQATGPLNIARARHCVAPLPGGKVIALGGLEVRMLPLPGVFVQHTAEVYDPAAGTWTLLPAKMTHGRWDAAAAPLPGGRVLIAGGKTNYRNKGGKATAGTELFAAAAGTFSPGPPMSEAREMFTATTMDDGRAVFAGGNAAEVFDPASNTFSQGVNLRLTRTAHSAAAVGADKVLLAGAESARAGGTLELIDLTRKRSTVLAAKLTPAIDDLALAVVGDDAYVFGGQRCDDGKTISQVQWISLTGGAGGRAAGAILPAKMGETKGISDQICETFGPLILVAGGEADLGKQDVISQHAWLFDARSRQFIASAKMVTPHDDFCAIPLDDPFGLPAVLLVGGLTPRAEIEESPQRECEILLLVPDGTLLPMQTLGRSGIGIVE